MSAKQYLKMADVFTLPVKDEDRKSAVEVFSRMVSAPYSVEYTVSLSQYAAHAINSHDELVAENERLRNALECATNHFPGAAKMVAHEGWQLVPVEPTSAMLIASGSTAPRYQAMLAAAPKPEGGAS